MAGDWRLRPDGFWGALRSLARDRRSLPRCSDAPDYRHRSSVRCRRVLLGLLVRPGQGPRSVAITNVFLAPAGTGFRRRFGGLPARDGELSLLADGPWRAVCFFGGKRLVARAGFCFSD